MPRPDGLPVRSVRNRQAYSLQEAQGRLAPFRPTPTLPLNSVEIIETCRSGAVRGQGDPANRYAGQASAITPYSNIVIEQCKNDGDLSVRCRARAGRPREQKPGAGRHEQIQLKRAVEGPPK